MGVAGMRVLYTLLVLSAFDVLGELQEVATEVVSEPVLVTEYSEGPSGPGGPNYEWAVLVGGLVLMFISTSSWSRLNSAFTDRAKDQPGHLGLPKRTQRPTASGGLRPSGSPESLPSSPRQAAPRRPGPRAAQPAAAGEAMGHPSKAMNELLSLHEDAEHRIKTIAVEMHLLYKMTQETEQLTRGAEDEIQSLQAAVQEKDDQLAKLDIQVKDQSRELGELRGMLEEKDGMLAKLDDQVNDQSRELGQLRGQLEEKDGMLTKLDNQVNDQARELGQLRGQLEDALLDGRESAAALRAGEAHKVALVHRLQQLEALHGKLLALLEAPQFQEAQSSGRALYDTDDLSSSGVGPVPMK